MPIKIGITGGASAGHVVPALAVAQQLRRDGHDDLVYFGRPGSIEQELAARAGLRFVPVSSAGLRRYRSAKNLLTPFAVVRGLGQAYLAMRRERPDAVFAKGSYVAVPVGIAARLTGIPLVIHESDNSLGLANRILAPLATRVLLSSPDAVVSARVARKAVRTGLPVRDDLAAGDPERLRRELGFGTKPVLLVFCGSGGAVRVNEAVRGALDELLELFQILHVTGRGNLAESLEGTPGYRQVEYLHDDMVDALWLADVVIGRAGASTLSELAALGKPAVLVPLPASASRGDQIVNADLYVDLHSGSVVVPDDEDLSTALPKACMSVAAGVADKPPALPVPEIVHEAAARVAAIVADAAAANHRR